MSSSEYADPLLNIVNAVKEAREKIRSAREMVEELSLHTGIIEGYLYGATRKQLTKDPETLDHFIKYLGIGTGALSAKAAELDQYVLEMRTVITTARANAGDKECGNVSE